MHTKGASYVALLNREGQISKMAHFTNNKIFSKKRWAGFAEQRKQKNNKKAKLYLWLLIWLVDF